MGYFVTFVTGYLDFVPGGGIRLGGEGPHKEGTRVTAQSESVGILPPGT